ncbi:MAG: 50S ribosomal protein L10 [Patescibacteria group bacterium]|jgi:large subunit ribosomal protein L10
MAKTKEAKNQLKDSLSDKLKRAKIAVLLKYQGLKVKDLEELRKSLRNMGIDMVVPKNSIAKISLKEQGIEVTGDAFSQPLAMIFSYDDEVKPAKEITLFAKSHEIVEILGGILENKMIDASVIKQLSTLPSREELLAKMVGSIASPLNGLVNVLSGVPRSLVNALKQIELQKK